jgi:hypothetical protein
MTFTVGKVIAWLFRSMHIKACDSVGIAVRILTSTLKVREGQVQPRVKSQWKKKKTLEVSGVLSAHLFCARKTTPITPFHTRLDGLWHVSGIEPQFFDCPACSLITIWSKLS